MCQCSETLKVEHIPQRNTASENSARKLPIVLFQDGFLAGAALNFWEGKLAKTVPPLSSCHMDKSAHHDICLHQGQSR